MSPAGQPPAALFREALERIVPYEPGKPVEEVQRELGLDRVVKLASNEGPFGPFPAALEAIERSARDLNRYPDGGAYALRAALAERHGVRFEEVAVGAGSDGLVDGLSQAFLDPGDEVVFGWPSFPSYGIYATKMGATTVTVPLRDHTYDLDALLDAVTGRTKLLYVCHPNNPTGTMNTRDELDAFFDRVPPHVLVVLDQAYREYIGRGDYPDGIEEYAKRGRNVVVLRTFSKIYGLAGLRIGFAVGHEDVVRALSKTRRAFDLVTPAQVGALASLRDGAELERRRVANAEAMAELTEIVRRHGLAAVEGSVTNFVLVEVGEGARGLFDALLREGVIVRPTGGFGAPAAIRVTAGLPDEHELLDAALGRVLAAAPS